ncbi:hypothetical protein [Tepidibacillus fermentans]|uniref:Uncharacterized protein n=1 Tax=Tepidibacillus fermentans TaxID=1281767 RepID=A0A4R3KLH6_9BACI|nr:hypothetical protein [Tepidibacillus fermentans]TCS84440.1 hypothetical protein EDD72_101104 [Tepidibacillus fermentans]
MMKLEDAVNNWLQIAVVHEARPNDNAAKETKDFFALILEEDHGLKNVRYVRDPFEYTVYFEKDGKEHLLKFQRALIEKLLEDIESEPKYNQ